jgi:ABC-type multidrug transport system ATPase subunit
VILSTHIVEDVMDLCTNMAIIHKGKVLFAGSPEEGIRAIEGRIWQKKVAKGDLAGISRRHRVISHKLIAGSPLVHVFSEQDPGEGFVSAPPDLEDVFFTRITGLGSGDGRTLAAGS